MTFGYVRAVAHHSSTKRHKQPRRYVMHLELRRAVSEPAGAGHTAHACLSERANSQGNCAEVNALFTAP